MKRFKIFAVILITLAFLSNVYSQTPLKLNLTGGANVPMGDFKEMYKTGFSVEGGVFYTIPKTGVDLTFTLGYNGFGYKNEYFTNLVQTNLNVAVDGFAPEWTATDIPLMVGVKYNLPIPVISPYVWGEAGVHFLSFKDRLTGKSTGSSSNPTKITLSTEQGSETAFGYAIGAGVTIPILPKIGIDFNIKYNGNGGIYSKQFEVFRNNNSQFTNPEMKNMGFVTARAGILITL